MRLLVVGDFEQRITAQFLDEVISLLEAHENMTRPYEIVTRGLDGIEASAENFAKLCKLPVTRIMLNGEHNAHETCSYVDAVLYVGNNLEQEYDIQTLIKAAKKLKKPFYFTFFGKKR